jgi:hypothetical protein
MVHALLETWRVLRPGGKLVDLRPFADRWPVEVVVDGKDALAGRYDDSDKAADDAAADAAVVEILGQGWFNKESAESFELAYYWNSAEGLKTFLEDNWTGVGTIPEEVFSRIDRLENERSEVRIRRSMHIASYWKAKQPSR